MAFLKSSELFTYVLESGPGVFDPLVSATDIDIRLRDLDWTNENERDNESSEYMTGTWFGSDESIVGKKTIGAPYSLKIAPGEYTPATVSAAPVDAGHKLNYSDLLENCGMSVTIIDGELTDDAPALYAFYPDQANAEKTMSVARILYDSESDTNQISLGAGAMSNFSLAAEGTAMPFTLSLDTQGRSEGVINTSEGEVVAKLDESNVMRTVADAMRNTSIKITDLETMDEVSFCITSFNMESGNELNQVECQITDSGIKNMIITKVNPNIVIDPLLRTLTDFNWWDAVSQERFYTLEVDSEFVHLYVPRAQINANAVGESNGFMRNELTFRPLINIDGDYPSWLTTPPANVAEIPYFLGIEEREAQY